MTNALELLKSAATSAPVGGKTPVDVFISKIQQQKAYIADMKANKAVNSRVLWFKKQGGEYVLRVGRSGLEIAGSKFFKAKDLDAVADLLDAVKSAIEADKALQDEIAKTAQDRTAKLRAGRAKKKAK